MNKNRSTLLLLFAAINAVAFLAACDSGSFGSDVGDGSNQLPVSKPFVQNGGESGRFREGSEVILASKSEDPDGPILEFDWSQSAGPAPVNGLIERTQSVVSFTAPRVDDETTLTFDLTVTDSRNVSDTASVSITVVPARDSGQLLSFDFDDPSNPFDSFTIVAALASGSDLSVGDPGCAMGAMIDPTDAIFDVTVDFLLRYPDRNGDIVEESLLMSPSTVSSFWPACTNTGATDEISAPWNPRFSFNIPRLDINDFNQRFADGDRSRILDPDAIDEADINVSISLSAGANQAQADVCVLVDGDTPILLNGAGAPECKSNDGIGLPTVLEISTQDLLNAISDRESALTAEVYYRAVDPNDDRLTLNQWLQFAGFADKRDGVLRPEATSGDNTANGEFAHAIYLNNFDLGFGRDMYTRVDGDGNVFSFVTNYASLEGAVRNIGEFVTVVMEYSPPDDSPFGDNFVKFFTYVPDGSGDSPRVLSMNFDGRGERYTPGNCVACHGGGPPVGVAGLVRDPACSEASIDASCYAYPNGGNLNATFMSWDLESFLFSDTDPGITNAPVAIDGTTVLDDLDPNRVYTRAAQEAQFKKLNQAALVTYDPAEGCDQDGCRFDSVIDHIYGWYGGPTLPSTEFDGTFIPDGWLNDNNPGAGAPPNDPETLYLEVFAQYCRACHNQLEDKDEQFSSYQDFIEDPKLVETVYQRGAMPLARLTVDRFWTEFEFGSGTAAERLRVHLESIGVDPDLLSTPGTPQPDISGAPDTASRNQTIRLDGSASLFADEFAWYLLHTPDPSGVASSAELAGASSALASFETDVPGSYEVTLALNGADAQACLPEDERCASKTINVSNLPPVANGESYTLDLQLGGTLDSTLFEPMSVLENDLDDDGDELVPIVVTDPQYGELAFGANGTFVYVYTESVFTPPSTEDSFRYRISDGFGGQSEADVTIGLSSRPDEIAPTQPQDLAGVDSSTTGPSSDFRVQLNWSASTDNETSILNYNIFRQELDSIGGPIGAEVAISTNNTVPSFEDRGLTNDTTYRYEVSAEDVAGNESQRSTAVQVTTNISYRLSVDSLWDDEGCTGCHVTDMPNSGNFPLRLDQTPSENHACIVGAGCTIDPSAVGSGQRNRATPGDATALILCKPTNTCLPHTANPYFSVGSDQGQGILRWLQQGAQDN